MMKEEKTVYRTVGKENGKFVIKGEFNTKEKALDLANSLNEKYESQGLYYDWCEVKYKMGINMKIKDILDEIANESSTTQKMIILGKYKNDELLKRVLYLACSKRIKFYIKQIPEYKQAILTRGLVENVEALNLLTSRWLTGSDAIKHLASVLSLCELDDAYVIERIISKDLKINLGTTLINKVFKDLIEKTPYLGAVPFEISKARKIFEKGKFGISEKKSDGRYVNILIRGGEVELESRSGEATVLGDCLLTQELSQLEDCVLNGELVMTKNFDRFQSNGIIASIIDIQSKINIRTEAETNKKIEAFKKDKNISFEEALSLLRVEIWDILDVDEYFNASSNVNRIDRLNRLLTTIPENCKTIKTVEYKIVKSYEEAMAHFVELLERGEEGTVLKSFDGKWKNGKHPHQIKLKLEISLDLVIRGFNYGGVGTKNENVISSILCESSCGKLTANAQVMSEDVMEYVTNNQDELLGKIAELKCNGLSTNRNGGNSVLYPTFISVRPDKFIANSFDECVEIDSAAKGLTKKDTI